MYQGRSLSLEDQTRQKGSFWDDLGLVKARSKSPISLGPRLFPLAPFAACDKGYCSQRQPHHRSKHVFGRAVKQNSAGLVGKTPHKCIRVDKGTLRGTTYANDTAVLVLARKRKSTCIER